MAERKQVDWEGVERDYSAGMLSLRELADKYRVAESYIRKKANQKDWSRDLSAKIQSKAEKLVRSEVVRSEVRSEKAITEKEIIEANAQAIVNIKLGHRTSIKKVNSLVESLLDEIETLNKDKSVENLPMRVDVTKKLMDTLKISIDKERQAFGIVDVPTPTENAITELVKVCQGNSVSITTSTTDFDEDDE
jgi:predicted house-cleaning noncanonical NTP pyrophosphatase (MazG superfamily)